MDYDNDGVLDFISGSYDPGDLYLFRGLGKGKYAAVENILDKSGQPVVHHPEEFAKYQKMKDDPRADEDKRIAARVASFGSWVTPVDWEADGDLDLLIGSFAGDLFLRRNEGARERPVYDTKSVPVQADGKDLHVNMHASPVAADWNDDGLWDLVVGSGDGAVGWLENMGDKTAPKFGAYQPLISPASDTKFFEQYLKPNDAPTHGVRAQICVTDYNHDGRLDLIVGDYSDVYPLRNLTDAQQAEFDALEDMRRKMISKAQKLRQAAYENQESETFKKELEQLQKDFETLDRKRKKFLSGEGASASFIWLFLRKEAADKSVAQAKPGESAVEPSNSAGEKQPVTLAIRRSNRPYHVAPHLWVVRRRVGLPWISAHCGK